MIEPNSPVYLYDFFKLIYPELKFWGMLGGILWTMFRGVEWVKQIKTNDLAHLHKSVESLEKAAREEGDAILNEFKEFRKEFHEDIRSLMLFIMTQNKQ